MTPPSIEISDRAQEVIKRYLESCSFEPMVASIQLSSLAAPIDFIFGYYKGDTVPPEWLHQIHNIPFVFEPWQLEGYLDGLRIFCVNDQIFVERDAT